MWGFYLTKGSLLQRAIPSWGYHLDWNQTQHRHPGCQHCHGTGIFNVLWDNLLIDDDEYFFVIHSNGSSLHYTNSKTFAILCLLSLFWSRPSTFSNKFPCDNFYRNKGNKQAFVKWVLVFYLMYILLRKHEKNH